MYDEQLILEKSLEPNVAEIYLILAKNGELTVPEIGQYTEFSRTVIYDCLSDLLAKDFLDYHKEGRKAFYKIKHPGKLMDLAEDKKREAGLFSDELANVVNALTGSYKLTENKPGVRFFEGVEGMKEALADSLNATETVYAFVDIDATQKYVDEINKEYVKKKKGKRYKKTFISFGYSFGPKIFAKSR